MNETPETIEHGRKQRRLNEKLGDTSITERIERLETQVQQLAEAFLSGRGQEHMGYHPKG